MRKQDGTAVPPLAVRSCPCVVGSGGTVIPWLPGHRRPAQSCSGGLGEGGEAASSDCCPFPALPMTRSATNPSPGPTAGCGTSHTNHFHRGQVNDSSVALTCTIPLLLCLPPEAAGTAIRVILLPGLSRFCHRNAEGSAQYGVHSTKKFLLHQIVF